MDSGPRECDPRCRPGESSHMKFMVLLGGSPGCAVLAGASRIVAQRCVPRQPSWRRSRSPAGLPRRHPIRSSCCWTCCATPPCSSGWSNSPRSARRPTPPAATEPAGTGINPPAAILPERLEHLRGNLQLLAVGHRLPRACPRNCRRAWTSLVLSRRSDRRPGIITLLFLIASFHRRRLPLHSGATGGFTTGFRNWLIGNEIKQRRRSACAR